MFGDNHLKRQNERLTEELMQALRVSQALNEKLADGLDRVLASKFDPPVMAVPTEQPKRDRLDVSDLLSVEDDTEFLDRMDAIGATT